LSFDVLSFDVLSFDVLYVHRQISSDEEGERNISMDKGKREFIQVAKLDKLVVIRRGERNIAMDKGKVRRGSIY
jgi:hypothetical protein